MAGFNVLAEAKIRKDTDLVISTKEQDGIKIVMIAQRLNVDQGAYSKGMFMKGAIKTDKEGLKNLLVAIEEALAAYKE
jgi:hypothetical protein